MKKSPQLNPKAPPIHIQNVKFSAASAKDAASGLIGWVSFTLNSALVVDGLTVRQTVDGRKTVSFPARRDGAGRDHFYLRPINDVARREIESRILGALGIEDSP